MIFKAIGLGVIFLNALGARQPNIVHIFFDDLGWQDIASHKIDGDPVHETPHMDQLTADGRRFTQAYSPAPSCAPSRVAYLRGQHVVNTGVYHVSGGRIPRPWHPESNRVAPYYLYGLPVEEPMIPEVLSKAGYVSGHVGKWHAGGKSEGYPFPLDQDFDFGFSEKDGRQRYYNDPELWRADESAKNSCWLLGNCFWRAATEPAVGPDQRAGKRGLRGERGAFAVFRCVGGRCFGGKTSGVSRDMAS